MIANEVIIVDSENVHVWDNNPKFTSGYLVIPCSKHHELPSFSMYLSMFPNTVILRDNAMDGCTRVCENCKRSLSCGTNLTTFAVGVRVTGFRSSKFSDKLLMDASDKDWNDHVIFKTRDMLENPFLSKR